MLPAKFGLGRLLVGLIMALLSLLSYCGSREFNPVTQEEQYVGVSPEQEIALGLEARDEMIATYGGLEDDPAQQDRVDAVCAALVERTIVAETEWPVECHLLGDSETINAFALPGGQVFVTDGLYEALRTEGQLAGVLAHEVAHVVARHAAQQIAKTQLTQGLTGAVVIAAYDPENPGSVNEGQLAAIVGELINMRYSREHELESDRLGVRIMAQAGYDPEALIGVMAVLDGAGGLRLPDFFSTHPNPDNRVERIREAIAELEVEGLPAGLIP